MFFSLALVLSSMSITFANNNNVPINPLTIPSSIYATVSYNQDYDVIDIELHNYTDYHSQQGYLRVYAQKTENNTTFKPIIAQCSLSSIQYDHYDIVSFGFGYYGGNNNLQTRFEVTEEYYGVYRTQWFSQWHYDNYYDGVELGNDDNYDSVVETVHIYVRSMFENETEFNTVTGLLDGSTYSDGYNDGRAEGEEYGHAKGYDEGFSDGESVGEETGYQRGLVDGYNNADMSFIFSGIVQVGMLPVNVFLAIFNWEIFGINLGAFVQGLLSVALVVIIFKFILGNTK